MASTPDSQQWKDGIRRMVSDHITDADLRIGQAAELAGVSTRTMQRVLSGQRDLNLLEAYRLGLLKPINTDND